MRSATPLSQATRPLAARGVPSARKVPVVGRAVPSADRRAMASEAENLLLLDGLPQMGILLSTVLRAAAVRLAALGFEVGKQPLRQPRTLANGRVVALEVAVSLSPGTPGGATGATPAAKKFLVRAGVMVRANRQGEWETDLLLWACSPSRSASAWPGLSTGSMPLSLTLATDQCEGEEFHTIGGMRTAMRRLEGHIDRGGATLAEVAGDFAENLLAACSPRRAA